jgi:hypothetical protein
MYCANCRTDVAVNNGYCSQCGTPLNTRLCPNGHIMDVTWTECRYCSTSAKGDGGVVPGSKGRTVIETGPTMTVPPSGVGAASGGFVKGATLLEGGAASTPKGGTVHESQLPKGKTVVEGPTGGRQKARTVFDSGTSDAPQTTAQPRLVGWLVSFSHAQWGEDYRLREGRNIIGADPNECDIVIQNDPSLSGKHAVIIFREGQFQIRDNDSTNGTLVRGVDIFGKGGVPIVNLDTLRLGKTEFTLYTIQQG